MMAVAHVYYLKDAHELVDAGIDGFMHLVRDEVMDDALIARDEGAQRLRGRQHRRLAPRGPDRAACRQRWRSWRRPSRRRRASRSKAERSQARDPKALRGRARHLRQDGAEPGPVERRRRDHRARRRHRHPRRLARLGRAVRARDDGRRRHDARAGDRGVDQRAGSDTEARRPGTVATGKSADFLVLDANPLENIANTSRHRRGVSAGQPLDRVGAARPLDVARRRSRVRAHGPKDAHEEPKRSVMADRRGNRRRHPGRPGQSGAWRVGNPPFKRRNSRSIRSGPGRSPRSRAATAVCSDGPPVRSAERASIRTTTSSR